MQDNNSKNILEKNSFKNIHISGDSRYTSVLDTLNKNKRIDKVEKFINGQKCFIAGSIWENDIKLILTANKISSIDINITITFFLFKKIPITPKKKIIAPNDK